MTHLYSILARALRPIAIDPVPELSTLVADVLESLGEHRIATFAVESGGDFPRADFRLRFEGGGTKEVLRIDFQVSRSGYSWNFGPAVSAEEMAGQLAFALACFIRGNDLTDVSSSGVKATDLLAALNKSGLESLEQFWVG